MVEIFELFQGMLVKFREIYEETIKRVCLFARKYSTRGCTNSRGVYTDVVQDREGRSRRRAVLISAIIRGSGFSPSRDVMQISFPSKTGRRWQRRGCEQRRVPQESTFCLASWLRLLFNPTILESTRVSPLFLSREKVYLRLSLHLPSYFHSSQLQETILNNPQILGFYDSDAVSLVITNILFYARPILNNEK